MLCLTVVQGRPGIVGIRCKLANSLRQRGMLAELFLVGLNQSPHSDRVLDIKLRKNTTMQPNICNICRYNQNCHNLYTLVLKNSKPQTYANYLRSALYILTVKQSQVFRERLFSSLTLLIPSLLLIILQQTQPEILYKSSLVLISVV